MAVFAVPSVLFIIFLFAGPESNNIFRPDWIINTFMDADGVVAGGQDLAEAAEDFFIMFGWLNLNLLIKKLNCFLKIVYSFIKSNITKFNWSN